MSALQASQSGLHQYLSGAMRRYRSELTACGELREATSCSRLSGLTVSAACHTGGKEGNQDYVATLVPHQPHRMRWAVAVADGVSSSLESEWGSQLASLTALLALSMHYKSKPTHNPPVASCLAHFRKLGELVSKQADACRPEDCSRFGWKFALREGQVMQSTLTVAWEDARGLHIEGIGDGGFILETEEGNPPLAHLPASDKPVRCLGPRNPQRGPDYHYSVARWTSLCIFTDGLTHLVPRWFPRLERAHTESDEGSELGPAGDVLQATVRFDRDELEDNITLASIRKEGR